MRNRAKYKAVLECPAELKPYVMTLFRVAKTAEEVNAVTTLLEAARRKEQRRASDEVTDHARRKLIGARLPREQVARYEEHARAKGLSVYAWVSQAIEKQHRAETDRAKPHGKGRPLTAPARPARRRLKQNMRFVPRPKGRSAPGASSACRRAAPSPAGSALRNFGSFRSPPSVQCSAWSFRKPRRLGTSRW